MFHEHMFEHSLAQCSSLFLFLIFGDLQIFVNEVVQDVYLLAVSSRTFTQIAPLLYQLWVITFFRLPYPWLIRRYVIVSHCSICARGDCSLAWGFMYLWVTWYRLVVFCCEHPMFWVRRIRSAVLFCIFSLHSQYLLIVDLMQFDIFSVFLLLSL